MRFYRLTHVAPNWKESAPTPSDNGHPLYVHGQRQGAGRFDQPAHYLALYIARQQAAAIGEIFQSSRVWLGSELTRPRDVGDLLLERCIVSLEVDSSLIDLDDPAVLDRIGWRPSDVVGKDRAKTRELALSQWLEREKHGHGGLTWWSSARPAWTVAMAWAEPNKPRYPGITVVEVEPITYDHPAVVTAAAALNRPIDPSG